MSKKQSSCANVLLNYIMIVIDAGNNDDISADMHELLFIGIMAKIDIAVENNVINEQIKDDLLRAIISYDKDRIEELL